MFEEKFKEIFKKYKKQIIAAIIVAVFILLSFVSTVISLSNHDRKSNDNFNSSFSNEEFPSISSEISSKATIATTTPTRDIDTKHSTDYDKSIDDLKEIMKNNKWIGVDTIDSLGVGKNHSFSFDKDDIATISSQYEEEKVLINMKYVKSVIGINNTYRIVCDLSFQDGKYITDSTLVIVLDKNTYEIKCEDFPIYQRFEEEK